MLLFHYTTEQNKTGIFKSGEIKPSAPGGLSPGWVSLTSDVEPAGHGLPDGRSVSWEQAKHLSHEIIGGVPHCWDHTKCRLTIALEESDLNLVWATAHHSKKELLGLDVSAHNPVDRLVPDLNLLLTVQRFSLGSLVRKSPMWWYYKNPIPISWIAEIAIRDASGKYVEVALSRS